MLTLLHHMADNKNQYNIKEALQAWLEKSKLRKKYEEARIVDSWEELMGKGIAKYTEKVFIKEHVLYIKVTSAPLKNELHMSRSQILQRFREEVGEDIVMDIRIL